MVKKELSIFRKRRARKTQDYIPKKRKITAKRRKPDDRAPPLNESEGLCLTETKTVVTELDRHFNIISRKVLDTVTKEWVDLI